MKILAVILPALLLLVAAPEMALNGSLMQKTEIAAPHWLAMPKGVDIGSAERSASDDLHSGRLRLPLRGDSAEVFRDLASQYERMGFEVLEVSAEKSEPGRAHRMLTAWQEATGRHATVLGVTSRSGETIVITYREVADPQARDVLSP